MVGRRRRRIRSIRRRLAEVPRLDAGVGRGPGAVGLDVGAGSGARSAPWRSTYPGYTPGGRVLTSRGLIIACVVGLVYVVGLWGMALTLAWLAWRWEAPCP